MKRVFQVFLTSIYLTFAGNYFDTFDLFKNEEIEYAIKFVFDDIFKDIERAVGKIEFNDSDGAGLLLGTVEFAGSIKSSYSSLDLEKFIKDCFSSYGKPDAKLCLRFYGYILYTNDGKDFVLKRKDESYENMDGVDMCHCTFYVLKKNVLGTDKDVVFFCCLNDPNYYVLKEGCKVYLANPKILGLEYVVADYDTFLEHEKRRNDGVDAMMSKMSVPSSTTSLMETKYVFKGSSDLRSIMTDKSFGPVSTDDMSRFRKKRTGAPTKGPLPPALGKKSNNNTGSSSDSDNKGNDSPKKCCRC